MLYGLLIWAAFKAKSMASPPTQPQDGEQEQGHEQQQEQDVKPNIKPDTNHLTLTVSHQVQSPRSAARCWVAQQPAALAQLAMRCSNVWMVRKLPALTDLQTVPM